MTDGIGEWSPERAALPSAEDLTRLAAAVSDPEHPEAALDALEADRVARLRAAMGAPRGALDAAVAALDVGALEACARFFTVVEARSGWEAGARSPVVPLMTTLRARVGPEAVVELTRWVKAHTDNRFLPWGSLQDRLRA